MPNFQSGCDALWQDTAPDSLLLHVFRYLSAYDLCQANCVCSKWKHVGQDEFLWKDLTYNNFKINRSISRMLPSTSWYGEYKRLHAHTPQVQSEVIHCHSDQVLHVSFSHRTNLFATTSKDGSVKVWDISKYPTQLKYESNLRELFWKYTQFSEFNETDTLLLVSGVHFGSQSTSGEIAVFTLEDEFMMQCRVINKPYDVFGCWYNESYLLSGNLYWMGNLTSCSAIWLNKAFQALESEHESVVMRLFKFRNVSASSIRTVRVANCQSYLTNIESETASIQPPGSDFSLPNGNQRKEKVGLDIQETLNAYFTTEDSDPLQEQSEGVNKDCENLSNIGAINLGESETNSDESQDAIEPESNVLVRNEQNLHDDIDWAAAAFNEQYYDRVPDNEPEISYSTPSSASLTLTQNSNTFNDKYLIFTMGTETYVPHVIGFKKIEIVQLGNQLTKASDQKHLLPDVSYNNQGVGRETYDEVDYSLDLKGHIIGMCLSPDHSYLYVNSRPWPSDYIIADPLVPPDIAQEIDIHVIDMHTLKEICKLEKAHKAYTSNDECFFIFLDVSDHYVASGAEDKFAYIWDRYYKVNLSRYQHDDVVNCVAFNPQDSEVLVSVSDDHSIKIWRSRHREKQLQNSKPH